MKPAAGVHRRNAVPAIHGGGGGYGDDPPAGRRPGRLPVTREQSAHYFRSVLSLGAQTPAEVYRKFTDAGVTLVQLRSALRAIGWPTGETEWPE